MTNVEGGPIDWVRRRHDPESYEPRERGLGEQRWTAARLRRERILRAAVRPRKEVLEQACRLGRVVGGWQLAGYSGERTAAQWRVTRATGLRRSATRNSRALCRRSGRKLNRSARLRSGTSVYLNSAAFVAPTTFQRENTARVLDWVRGFSGKSESISLAKRIPITEKVRGCLRADATNPFNFVRWNNPNTNITSANFGRVTALPAAEPFSSMPQSSSKPDGEASGSPQFCKRIQRGRSVGSGQMSHKPSPRQRAATPTLYFADGYHGGVRGHMPPGAGADDLERYARGSAVEAVPGYRSRSPGTCCAATIPRLTLS